MLISLNDEMMETHYLSMLETILKKWLCSSISTSVFAKGRSSFENGVIMKIMDDYPLIQNGEVDSIKNQISFSYLSVNYKIIIRTSPTHYNYPQCDKLTDNESDVLRNKLSDNIEQLFDANRLLHDTSTSKTFFVFIVFPCTHYDKDWAPYYSQIEQFIYSSFTSFDFRFQNNVPGCIYIGELNHQILNKENSRNSVTKYQNNDAINNHNLINESQSNSIRNIEIPKTKFKVNRHLILEQMRDEMEKVDCSFRKTDKIFFLDLQKEFERRVYVELEKQQKNGRITPEELGDAIKKFKSNGTGAVRAQLLLTTVNEKNRIHFRPNIKENFKKYNLFYYADDESLDLKIKNREMKPFDLENPTLNDNIKVYYQDYQNIKPELHFIRVQDLRG
jgi:hypothetical protein